MAVTDPERYGAYAHALPEVVERFGGRFLAAGGRMDAVEGDAKARNVVIAFDEYDTARACRCSPGYAEVSHLRVGAADVDIVIMEGVDPYWWRLWEPLPGVEAARPDHVDTSRPYSFRNEGLGGRHAECTNHPRKHVPRRHRGFQEGAAGCLRIGCRR
ncbi:DUF1330 domain-containing protein [Methylorubrum suomiense]|uniref:DUF1330 domain-containing protein n=1 Tax=Methylorubrum suomiense TaxID=144191 RepID=UPI0024B58B6A